MLKFAQGIILSSGWRRRVIALGSGATGALALPPFGFFPAFFIPMIAAVWLLDGAAGRRQSAGTGISGSSLLMAAGSGWWLGFGYFVAGLWWIGAAFLVDADRFAWAMPLGVVGLPVLLAMFTALGFVLARLLWSSGAARILALAVGLSASEWLRGHVLTGFPWNDLGMVLGANIYLGQFASVVGLFGLTVLAVAIFAAPACLADSPRWSPAPLLFPGLALAALAVFGTTRLAGGDAGTVKGVRLRIMQPNVQHDLKFRAARKDDLIAHYLALSERATSPQSTGLADVTHLIWPESAFPFILSKDAGALAKIGSALPPGTTLLTGAARLGVSRPGDQPLVFNSIQIVQSGGVIADSYDKVHLVPFGEYVPFAWLAEVVGLQQFVLGAFQPGPRRQLLSVAGLPPVAPLICYEAIFSGEVMPEGINGKAVRAGLFLNVTDDSWFGVTPGPHQHLLQARLRSIEEGIPMIRAADTGISAIIDPYGRIVAQLQLGEEGVLDGSLPKAAAATFFSGNGTWISVTIWFLALFSNLILRVRI